VRRYECPFCGQRRAARVAVKAHIGRCWLNPAVKACKTCVHFTSEPDGDYCTGEPCGCNQGHQQCEAGVPDVAEGKIVDGCPLWRLKEVPGA
jgi:hypothetical protein